MQTLANIFTFLIGVKQTHCVAVQWNLLKMDSLKFNSGHLVKSVTYIGTGENTQVGHSIPLITKSHLPAAESVMGFEVELMLLVIIPSIDVNNTAMDGMRRSCKGQISYT